MVLKKRGRASTLLAQKDSGPFSGWRKAMKKISLIVLAACFIASTGLMADNEVNAREDNQAARIDNGAASGDLSKSQTKHLDHQEKKIHKEVKRDRKANGGKLTKAEHRHVTHQQNHMSKKIHHEKKAGAAAKAGH
jgi:hypothetical protein